MRIDIRVTDAEGSRILWLLHKRYGSKASLNTLAKKAIRELVAQEAKKMLEIKAADKAAQ